MIDRKVAPPFVVPDFFPLKRASTEVLAGGIPIHFINVGDTELLRIEIIFKAGKWYQQLKGQAVLSSKLLLEGTKSFTSVEISSTFERNGAFFEISCGMDLMNFTIYTLNKNLPKLLPVIEEVLLAPTFPEKELEIIKNIQIQNLKVNQKKNNFQALRLFRENLFGKSHPYGSNTEIQDFENLTKADLQNYYLNTLKGNFEVIIAGKINKPDYDILNHFFSKFTIRDLGSNKAQFPDVQPFQQYIEVEGSLQSSLKIGIKTLHKSAPMYFHLLIFNEVLGGYFGSRLMQKIREEKGYSYGIHSSVVQHAHEAYFVISSDVIKKFREDALTCIYEEIHKLIHTAIPTEELTTVINYFKGSFLSSINSPYALADKFKNLHFNGLTYDYYDSMFNKLDSINPDSFQGFAEEYFNNVIFTDVSVG